MPSSTPRVPFAEITWTDAVPEAPEFGDVYFSRAGGLDETRFVFLSGTDFDQAITSNDHTVIGETGFGTGLNFLASWQRWKTLNTRGRFTFISTEAFPLKPDDLARAHASFPELAPYAEALQASWPPPSRGYHVIDFEDGNVRLILMFGDAAEQYKGLNAKIDLWYLDGFAPAKNQSMWSDEVLDEIARLSHAGTRLATFTAAGFVKRGLLARGFNVSKTPGFGRKRERLVASGTEQTAPVLAKRKTNLVNWATLPRPVKQGVIAVIGGGFGGRFTADALMKLGRKVEIFEDPTKTAASTVPAGVLSPRFLLDNQPVADLFSSAFVHSVHNDLIRSSMIAPQGLMQLPRDKADSVRQDSLAAALDWGSDWIEKTNDGLYLPKSGTVDTKKLLAQLPTPTPFKVADIKQQNDDWFLTSKDGENRGPFAAVVVAAGYESLELLGENAPPLPPNSGATVVTQTDDLPDFFSQNAISHKGYNSPEFGGVRLFGSTFERAPKHNLNDDEIKEQISKLTSNALDQKFEFTGDISIWRGTRATTTDYMPIAGPIVDRDTFREWAAPLSRDAKLKLDGEAPYKHGLYLLSGLGAKGLLFAPLLSKLIAAHITGTPYPLPLEIMAKLYPTRFEARNLIRVNKP